MVVFLGFFLVTVIQEHERAEYERNILRKQECLALKESGDRRVKAGDAPGALRDYRQALAVAEDLRGGDRDSMEGEIQKSLAVAPIQELLAAERQKRLFIVLLVGCVGLVLGGAVLAVILRVRSTRRRRQDIVQKCMALKEVGDSRVNGGDASGAFAAYQEALGIIAANSFPGTLSLRGDILRAWQSPLILEWIKKRDEEDRRRAEAFEQAERERDEEDRKKADAFEQAERERAEKEARERAEREARDRAEREARERTEREAKDRDEREARERAGWDASGNRDMEKRYGKVLGLKGPVSPDDIKRAHRSLMAQYHPDKVKHLGEQLQVVAAQMAKEINEAYDFFRRKYGF
ncbi:J domain-containing protein [Candidatus Micrarchaeota archaeon]|nr:J domain-containing protein [Candidatus Micrarchaeota archaeon]